MTEEHKDYIFFGHGWRVPGLIDLRRMNNVTIIALEGGCWITEDRDIEHMNILKQSESTQQYYETMLGYTENSGNKLCVYSSNTTYYFVPDMLLSTGTISGSRHPELTGLLDIETRGTSVNTVGVQTLEELLHQLGGNFTLLVFACRGPLSEEDFKGIQRGYFINDSDILDYINNKGIRTTEISTKSICQSFTEYLNIDSSEEAREERKMKYDAMVDERNERQRLLVQSRLSTVPIVPLTHTAGGWTRPAPVAGGWRDRLAAKQQAEAESKQE